MELAEAAGNKLPRMIAGLIFSCYKRPSFKRKIKVNRGFYIILAAQFCSALADNALLFAAIALLKQVHAPSWQTPVLQQAFILSFILLALLGAFADSLPKGDVHQQRDQDGRLPPCWR
jgi:hypothetical protein